MPDGAGEPADASSGSLVKWMRKDTGSREKGSPRCEPSQDGECYTACQWCSKGGGRAGVCSLPVKLGRGVTRGGGGGGALYLLVKRGSGITWIFGLYICL